MVLIHAMGILKSIRNWMLRNIVYRKYNIGKGFHSGRGVNIWARGQVNIGVNFYIGRYSQIECDAVIGNNVIFANFVSLVGRYDHHFQRIGVPIAHADRISWPQYKWRGVDQVITIGDDVWIGLGSIILSGVTIGEGSIVAAGSVVTKNVEPFCIVAGNPANKIRNRFENPEDLLLHIKLSRERPYKEKFMQPIVYR